MYRRILVACLAVIGALLHLIVDAGAQPKPDTDPKPNQGSEIYVIMKARLYEVDEAFHNKVAKAKWLSKADLEELETKPPADGSLFALLEKQKPFLAGKEINIDPGKEGVLLTATKPINCLPTPDQLRQGKKGPQTIDEGFTLSAKFTSAPTDVSCAPNSWRRVWKSKASKRSRSWWTTRAPKPLGRLFSRRKPASPRRVTFPTAAASCCRFTTGLRAVRKNDRWLVAEITPRIYIEEEERARRGQAAEVSRQARRACNRRTTRGVQGRTR